MSKPQGLRVPLPEHLITLENVQIPELYRDARGGTFFEVTSTDARDGTFFEVTPTDVIVIYKIRVSRHWLSKPAESIKWLNEHLNIPLDVTIFPYVWRIRGTSGVINYFQSAKVRQD